MSGEISERKRKPKNIYYVVMYADDDDIPTYKRKKEIYICKGLNELKKVTGIKGNSLSVLLTRKKFGGIHSKNEEKYAKIHEISIFRRKFTAKNAKRGLA